VRSAALLREAREMAAEMFEAEKEWLPQFKGKELRLTPSISVPANVNGGGSARTRARHRQAVHDADPAGDGSD